MADRDTLRPEVREAIGYFACSPYSAEDREKARVIHAELLRLAGNYNVANLLAQTWEAKYWAMRERAEKAEAELAALKARINK